MSIFKVAMLGVTAVLMAVFLRKRQEESGIFLSMAACIAIFGFCISQVEQVMELIDKVQSMAGLSLNYIGLLLKMIGITYVAEFSSSLCKDAGYSAIATQIQLFGKLSILVLSMPVLISLLDMVSELLS